MNYISEALRGTSDDVFCGDRAEERVISNKELWDGSVLRVIRRRRPGKHDQIIEQRVPRTLAPQAALPDLQ